jgi:hypothetical protein
MPFPAGSSGDLRQNPQASEKERAMHRMKAKGGKKNDHWLFRRFSDNSLRFNETRGKTMFSFRKTLLFFVALTFLGYIFLPGNLAAFYSISETRIFSDGPYAFKMEIQFNGTGTSKKPLQMSSLKVKIKNDRASSEVLKVKTIRAYPETNVFQDIETLGYPISPGQWVTKFYRLSKGKRPVLSDRGFIEIAFENFTIQFYPRERRFSGPTR